MHNTANTTDSLTDWAMAASHNLRALLLGEDVDGRKMGDPGLDESWIRITLAVIQEMLSRLKEKP